MSVRSKFAWILKASAVVLLASYSASATAAENTDSAAISNVPGAQPSLITDLNEPNQEASQVTSVSQLSDVQPTDWAFQALQSLVERYGCIAGYPNGTFRGNRAATRYELAAALNACLDQISDRFSTKEDLETVKALQEEFRTELATLKGRVDGLEARTATLEAQQFSTTTKLNATAIFAAGEVFSGNDRKAVAAPGYPTAPLNARPFFGDRVRLNFDTSFTGKDQLRVRLQARNIDTLNGVSGTNSARLGFDGNENNTVYLDQLWYRFPINKNGRIVFIANAANFNDFVGSNFNPYLQSSDSGSLSRFTRFNPIYRFSDGTNTSSTNPIASAGLMVNYKFTDYLAASVGYIGNKANTSVGPTGGLAGGSYSALAQLEIKPFKKVGVGLTYVHSSLETGLVNVAGSTGSAFANNPFGGTGAARADSAGVEGNAQLASWLAVSAWAGYTHATETNGAGRNVDLINWAASVQFPNLLGPGNLGALTFGQVPRVFQRSSNFTQTPLADRNESYLLEALYKFKVNGNISVTPGVIVIFNPENNKHNATEYVPVVRTTFSF